MYSSTSTSSPFAASTSAQPRPPPSSTLSNLLAQANSLNHAGASGGGSSAGGMGSDLPQIRLGIDEIERMSEGVAGRGKGRKGRNGEGHTLLSSLGVNTSQLNHSIAQLPSSESQAGDFQRPKRRRRPAAGAAQGAGGSRIDPLGHSTTGYGTSESDMHAWGRNWHEMVILSGIEAQRQKTIKSFQTQFQQRMLQNWEDEKARVLQDELGVTDDEISRLASSSTGALGQSGLGRSTLGSSTRRFPMAQSTSKAGGSAENKEGGLVMHTKMLRYERVIQDLNQKRIAKQPMELCQALEDTVKGDAKHPTLPVAYHILAHLVQEPSLRDASNGQQPEPVQERQYAQAYLGDQRGNQAKMLRERLTLGGRRFLERDFENHIDETIAKHPKEASLGGVPGIRNKVRAYTDVTLRSKDAQDLFKPESVDGIYLWSQLYHLLRCGYPTEAMALLSDHQNALKRDDYSFPGALRTCLTSPDRRLPRVQRDQLSNDFNSTIRNNATVDQYKYALYKLVGRFELSRKTMKVASTTEDWMWVQLSLVREGGAGEGPQEQYDLADLGRMVLKYGADKFDEGGKRPFVWFDLLLYTGQFERAVAYLWSKQALRSDAVHFGIALAYYGLLRVPSKTDATELLITEETPFGETTYLNFYRMIKTYIAPFFKVEPQSALQYAYLVALGADAPGETGQRQKVLALELVRDVVLASRAWGRLLGSVKADGSKTVGLIERDLKLLKLTDEREYVQAVILSAADQSSLDASLVDSIGLYHLAGSYDRVVDSVNRALGHSLAQPNANLSSIAGGQSLGLSGAFGGADDVYELAQRVQQVYDRDVARRNKVRRDAWETLEVLLKLKRGMKEFAADRPDLALETFRSTNLLPLSPTPDPSSIPRHAQRFTQLLDQPVISNLDDVIVTTMKCLHRLSQALKQSPYGDQGRMGELAAYKQQAQGLIQFAGGLRLRLGGDVYRQLSSMSAFF